MITEGEKKTLSLHNLAAHMSEAPTPRGRRSADRTEWGVELPRKGRKAPKPEGTSVPVTGPILDLDRVDWKGRKVTIVFDSNIATNESVRAARSKLSCELKGRGADVLWADLPEIQGVNGIDDLLGLWGADQVSKLLQTAEPFSLRDRAGRYRMTEDGIGLWIPKKEEEVRLTNFRAVIAEQQVEDDGTEKRRR